MPSPGLQSFVGSWYSVVAYGAGGAGNTNDTTAIQAAMTAANGNGGGTVVVPAGTYRLDSSLSWTGLTNVCLWLGTGASFTGVGTVTAASGTNNSIFDQRTSGGGGGGGTVTSVSGTSPISVATGTTTPAISFDGTAALSQSNTITGTAVGASGLTGAANPVRIVGRNASGTPASGTFAVGDVVINTDGTEYVCTVAGTPGTWVALNPGYGTPVAVNGQTTSLSAGTALTAARSDHVHTSTNSMALLASYTVSTAAASIQIASGIDGRFRNLHLLIRGRSNYSGSVDTCSLQFNGDTGTNYYGAYGNQTNCPMFYLNAQGNYGNIVTSGTPSTASILIHDYSVTGSNPRVLSGINGYNNNSAAYSLVCGNWYGAWVNTSQAITSITALSIYGQFVAGSTFQLYGMY